MAEVQWPKEYIEKINVAANLSVSGNVEEGVRILKQVKNEFKNHPAFIGVPLELEKSILRNLVLILTLTNEGKSKLALEALLNEGSQLVLFSEDERAELERAIRGKLRDFG